MAIIVCVITNGANNQRIISQNSADNERTRALIEYRLGELEKKQDKHNSVIERTYHLEQKVAVLEEQQKVANHRISDLKEDTKEK